MIVNRKKQIILSIVGILFLVSITLGVTYAVFTYTKLGSTENTVTAGTLKFIYTENTGVGNGISITDALPVADSIGKAYLAEGQVFDFSIEATNTSNEVIPYEVTLRKTSDSSLPNNAIKVYLTDMTEGTDSEILAPILYSDLKKTKIDVGDEIEKTIYQDGVEGNTDNYLKKFRLRMWVDESVDLANEAYSNKTFTVIVNVYANAKVVETTEDRLLKDVILSNPIIETAPTLTTSSNNTSDESGLYKSTETNSGNPTYYFRGNVENNYVSFAGQTWRIVRVNEDGTIRMIMQDAINNSMVYKFNSNYDEYTYMYYTNSEVKTILEEWYNTNLLSYIDQIARGDYFCEQAKVKPSNSYTSGNVTMALYSSYTPNFKCETDENGKGVVNGEVGLITYDEVIYAGGYRSQENNEYYLYNGFDYWTMSPAGTSVYAYTYSWYVDNAGIVNTHNVSYTYTIRPTLNLKANVTISKGSGSASDPYIVS